jgi:hypothetical protein
MICRSSFASKKLAKCSDSEHLLFYALILNADDEGRGDGDGASVTFYCANRKWEQSKVAEMMKKLRDVGLILWYSVEDELFYEVVDFDRYQYGSWQGKHKKDSLIPKMSEGGHRVRRPRTPSSSPPDTDCVAKLMECKEREGKTSELSVPDAPLFSVDSIPYSLAEYLRKLILENDSKAKVPNPDSKTFQNWCLDIDRLIRIDKREPELIAAIIHWCQNHHGEKFSWSSNILSAGTLRKQFPKLYLQAKEAGVSLWFERGD